MEKETQAEQNRSRQNGTKLNASPQEIQGFMVTLEQTLNEISGACEATNRNTSYLIEVSHFQTDEISVLSKSNIRLKETVSSLDGQVLEQASSLAAMKQTLNTLCLRLSALESDTTTLSERTQEMNESFRAKIARNEAEAQAVETLAEELEAYKRAEFHSRIRPAIMANLAAYDLVCDQLIHAKDRAAENGLRAVKNQILQSLRTQGVEKLEPSAERFDPAIQEIADVKAVAEREQHEMVLKVIKDGFVSGTQVIRPQMVQVGKYQQREDSDGYSETRRD